VIALAGDALSVEVLDPVADRHLLGTRYCTAGFIFQVEDPDRGPLLAGPTYPHAYELFGGQGAPDAFQPHLPVERAPDGTPSRVLGIGIGLIDTRANEVVSRCPWIVERDGSTLRFLAVQEAAYWRFTVERTLALRGRTLQVRTRIANGGDYLPFQWYPHPFFPHDPGGECCRFNVPVTLPDNPGYEIRDNGFIARKNVPWKGRDHFQLVGYPGDRPLTAVHRHPLTGIVAVSCDYVPTRLPIWGNDCAFSFEPYHERMLQPGEEARWSITYDF